MKLTNFSKEKVEVQSSKVMEIERKFLVGQCAAVLRQGIDLLENLDDAVFTGGGATGKSSVGAHFRHNLDFVRNFLIGSETGEIDYNARERNSEVETDRAVAAQMFRQAVAKLENLTPDFLAKKVLVRSETIQTLRCESSVLRELEFLQSHTIHHYALIRIKLEAFGVPVPADFGVAPSTLEFWRNSAECPRYSVTAAPAKRGVQPSAGGTRTKG